MKAKVKYTTRPVSELVLNAENPRTISKDGMDRIKKSLQELGQLDPILVNINPKRKDIVLSGNMRLRAMLDLGWTECDVAEVNVPPEKEKAVVLMMNNHQGEWSADQLEKYLHQAIFEDRIDYDLTGFNERERSLYLDKTASDEVETEKTPASIDEAPPLPKKPKSKPGDIYQLGNHRVMCGNATSIDDMKKLAGDMMVDLIFTDPPYNVDYESQAGNSYGKGKYAGTKNLINDDLPADQFQQFIYDAFSNANVISKPNASFYCWYASANVLSFKKGIEDAGWHILQSIIWIKEQFVFGLGVNFHRLFEPCFHGYKTGGKAYFNREINNWDDCWGAENNQILNELDVWKERRDPTATYVHPTQKPVNLAKRGLLKSSVPGGVVLDMFGGSGSTLMACEELGRVALIMELDPGYIDVIVQRWENWTGEKAIKI